MATLNDREKQRYARHFSLPDFGEAGQIKLKQTSVLIIGAGGLGSPLLQYLAAAGLGRIGIVDFDMVDESNLQRQVLFNLDDVGRSKAQVAKRKLHALNPHVEIQDYTTAITIDNVLEILEPYDIIADGSDNFATRYLVNDACVLMGKPLVYGSIFRYEGQVSVFNALRSDGSRGPHYRDLYPHPPAPGSVPNCAAGGVLGVLPGIIGSLQANEVINLAAGFGELLDGKLLLFDAASMQIRTLKFKSNPDIVIHDLTDYQGICDGPDIQTVKEIDVATLQNWINTGKDFQLIDVREADEYRLGNIGAELLPLSELDNSICKVDTHRPVVLHCRSGQRSAQAIRILQQKSGHEQLYNLKGGYLAWMGRQIG